MAPARSAAITYDRVHVDTDQGDMPDAGRESNDGAAITTSLTECSTTYPLRAQ